MKNIVNLINLSQEQSVKLLSIYKNCKSYKIRYKYPSLFQNELLWPETQEEYNWIVDNVLSHFSLNIKEIAHIPYNEESVQNMKNYISLPYKPSAINFVHFYPGDYVNSHNSKQFSVEYEAKINIPVLNTHIAALEFEESKERSCYPSPILINSSYSHKVLGMGKDLQDDRVLLQLMLKDTFSIYYKKLKWNNYQENSEKN